MKNAKEQIIVRALAAAIVALSVAPFRAVAQNRGVTRAIYDAHEHIQSINEVPKMLAAMDACGIKMAILVGSANITLKDNSKAGFTGYHENNLELLEIQRRYPGRFMAFPTIDPLDPDKLGKLKSYVAQGARGLKLYLGSRRSFKNEKGEWERVFHTMPLDDPSMETVYNYCERIGLPVNLQVYNRYYLEEFERLLSKHPGMVVICPHFMLLSTKLDVAARLLDTYPNLYTDVGFVRATLSAGFRRISKKPFTYRKFIGKYRDRILFATSMVVTDLGVHNTGWISKSFTAYTNLLEERRFEFYLLPLETLNGLNLDEETLDYIYRKNLLKLFPPDKDFRDAAEHR